MRAESTPREIHFGVYGDSVRALVRDLCQVDKGIFFKSSQPALFPPENPWDSPPAKLVKDIQRQGIDPETGIFSFQPFESLLEPEEFHVQKADAHRRYCSSQAGTRARARWELIRHSRKRKNAGGRTYEEDCLDIGSLWADCIFRWAWLGEGGDTSFDKSLEKPLKAFAYKWGLPYLGKGLESIFLRYDLDFPGILALASILKGKEVVEEIVYQLSLSEEKVYGNWASLEYSLLDEGQSAQGVVFPLTPKRQKEDPAPRLQGPPMLVFELEAEWPTDWDESHCPFSLDDLRARLVKATGKSPLVFHARDSWIEESCLEGTGGRIAPKWRSSLTATFIFPLESIGQVHEIFLKAKEVLGEAAGVSRERLPGPKRIHPEKTEEHLEKFRNWLSGDRSSWGDKAKQCNEKIKDIERQASLRARF